MQRLQGLGFVFDRLSVEGLEWLKAALKCVCVHVGGFGGAFTKKQLKMIDFLFRRNDIFLYFCSLNNKKLSILIPNKS